MKTVSTLKFNFIFFLIYSSLMVSLIFFATHFSQTNKQDTYIKTNEVSETFSKELNRYKDEKKLKETNGEHNRWKPSKSFAITAIGISSVLDIIIILLWAKHENNKKRAGQDTPNQRRKWTDSPKFWKFISIGMLQMKNERIHIHWINTILIVIVMILLKLVLTKTIL
ncbi:hypothetical protein [Bacillus sp. S/N-304-OC-R1]|uniref:hypothetical protein n=1 Tax=Bacillus sp. S/N-304-OC-R1 TaxID=2758034 RepID=UPI001C8D56CD|nr:hypothetical protein [Bacillus sp. S/N-304-OC-R1]MBY0123033.1 hypothetical protein [Bacillus sp. S/N-304-OC-R1]